MITKMNIIFFIFILNVFIFFTIPLIAPLNIENNTFQQIKLYYRALTGVGFEFKMFAPKISSIKYDMQLIFHLDEKKSKEVVNWRDIVPFNYRLQLQHLFGFGGNSFNLNGRNLKNIEMFLLGQLKLRQSKRVKVIIKEYEIIQLGEAFNRIDKIVWEHEFETNIE